MQSVYVCIPAFLFFFFFFFFGGGGGEGLVFESYTYLQMSSKGEICTIYMGCFSCRLWWRCILKLRVSTKPLSTNHQQGYVINDGSDYADDTQLSQ